VLESLFSSGIKAHPDPEITAVLTRHICESVALGAREEYGAPLTAGLVAVPAWHFLGEAYGSAVGLPKASSMETLFGHCRMLFLELILLTYLLVPGACSAVHRLMRYFFTGMVLSVRKAQPSCRFGVTESPCPFKGSGFTGLAQCPGR